MEKYQIFISYRREGGDAFAGRLADRFTAMGYNVFFDVESMHSGTFNTQILEAIRQCSDVIAVLPPHALDRCVNENDWVRQELAYALKHSKNIIPVMMQGFEFPEKLPADIDKLRYMDGIAAANDKYYDAMISLIEKQLIAGKAADFSFRLDSQEHFKISTPLINIYKKHDSTPRAYMNIAVLCEGILAAGQLSWTPPAIGTLRFSTIREFCEFAGKAEGVKWYDKNEERLTGIRRRAIALKSGSDLYFYNNALIFAMGSLASMPSDFIHSHPSLIVEMFCYCMDFPEERFGDFEQAYDTGKLGYAEFRDYIPLPFDAWADYHKGPRMDSQSLQQFDSMAILLFDFMIELSILILDTCRDSRLSQIRTGQIRSYYKWMKKHRLYPPKEIQEKIYRYL